MAIFTVHMKPVTVGIEDRRDVALKAAFLKDGFNWAAFVFGPFWLLINRLWLDFVAYVAIAMLLGALAGGLNLPPPVAPIIMALVNLLLGLEASSLLRAGLERQGFRDRQRRSGHAP